MPSKHTHHPILCFINPCLVFQAYESRHEPPPHNYPAHEPSDITSLLMLLLLIADTAAAAAAYYCYCHCHCHSSLSPQFHPMGHGSVVRYLYRCQ